MRRAAARLGRALLRFFRDEEGPTSIEYALLIAGIVAVVVGTVFFFGSEVWQMFGGSVNSVTNAYRSSPP